MEMLSASMILSEGNPPVTAGFPSKRAGDVIFFYQLWQTIEQTIMLQVIWDAMMLTWRHCTGKSREEALFSHLIVIPIAHEWRRVIDTPTVIVFISHWRGSVSRYLIIHQDPRLLQGKSDNNHEMQQEYSVFTNVAAFHHDN